MKNLILKQLEYQMQTGKERERDKDRLYDMFSYK